MTNNKRISAIFSALLACALLMPQIAFAQLSEAEMHEMAGTGDGPSGGPIEAPNPAARQAALAILGTDGLLLIPESSNDRVMAFDPTTGDLVDPDFIPADPDNLSTPIQAILSPDGTQVYVSDQLDDVVQAYDVATGAFVATFAPAGGANTAILDNVRGIALRPNGNLLVSVGGGANDDAIAEFDGGGVYVGNFVANGAGGLNSPFDVFAVVQPGGSLAAGDFLVPGITSDAVHRYNSSGAPQANFAPLNTFGEQAAQAANGNVLVANFSGTQEGVVEFLNNGTVVDIYDPASLGGYRGVYELPNGNILTTNGSGVHEINRSGALVETKISGVSGRFITFAGPGGGGEIAIARFEVNKFFDDGNPGSVGVEITCNTGLPLNQPATISEGDNVVFVVTDFENGALNCTVVETDGQDGYATAYESDGESTPNGCVFTAVEFEARHTCDIYNTLQTVDVDVTKWWMDENPEFNSQNHAEADYSCANEVFYQVSGSLQFFGDGDTSSFEVYPDWDGSTTCTVTETLVETGVETDDSECASLSVTPGNGASCNIYNTRLYEGIPTLSQYGLGVLVMLMLGLGLVAYRRIV